MWALAAVPFLIFACTSPDQQNEGDKDEAVVSPNLPTADPGNGGIKLPAGFGAVVVADSLGRARHIAVADNGDIYVKLSRLRDGKGILALRDTNGDGRADKVEAFADYDGTGLRFYNNFLYSSNDSVIFRNPLKADGTVDFSVTDTVVSGFTSQRQHANKALAFDKNGNMYVGVGAPSNACQEKDRTPGNKGMEPCPLLEYHGGIWRFDANKTNQTQIADGYRYTTGIRNTLALDWNPAVDKLYCVQHGRDQLSQLWPDMFNDEQSAEQPAEELMLTYDGADFGWPYCYYDPIQKKRVTAPEYGGDGKQSDKCGNAEDPLVAFPAHWAPNDLMFYTGDQFPARYKNGAFICFHGSWNRAPLMQAGYFIAFIPFDGDKPSGDWEVFAEDFAGGPEIKTPGDAKHRPMGIAQGPDGSIYVSDSQRGKIWRVGYYGDKLAAN